MNLGCRTILVVTIVATYLPAAVQAQSTVNIGENYAYGANMGWLDAHPSAYDGLRLTDNVCSGYLYAANFGWIHLGSGNPANGIRYSNASAGDYGVNVFTFGVDLSQAGRLRGFAYAANIGWINFGELGDPRIDLSTGRLSGAAYAANAGWISLGEFSTSISSSIALATDSDSDGIPDAWELSYFGDLTAANATSDFDQDGQSDHEEFVADTDPKSGSSLFSVTGLIFDLAPSPDQLTVTISTRPTRRYLLEFATDLAALPIWIPSGLGVIAPGLGATTTQTFPAADASQTFVRVLAVRPLAP